MIDKSIYSILTSYTAITDLVSDRIFAGAITPDGSELPAIIYFQVAQAPEILTHDQRVKIYDVTFQISIGADEPKEAKTLAGLVESALLDQDYSSAIAGNKIFYVRLGNKLDLSDYETKLFQVALDFEIRYQTI